MYYVGLDNTAMYSYKTCLSSICLMRAANNGTVIPSLALLSAEWNAFRQHKRLQESVRLGRRFQGSDSVLRSIFQGSELNEAC